MSDSLVKKPAEIEKMREGGKRLSAVLSLLEEHIFPGTTTKELDQIAEEKIRGYGDIPAFLNYRPSFADDPFPASLCVSINEEVVHGIPSVGRVLAEGDIVSIDLGLSHNGFIVDSARSIIVGGGDDTARKLVSITRDALSAGIESARAGNTLGHIGASIEEAVSGTNFSIVTTFAGHFVGYAVHEDPVVPNTGTPGEGLVLTPGMTLALEPMVNEGSADVEVLEDGYTVRTKDGKRSAHFEHTILITENAPEVLTQ